MEYCNGMMYTVKQGDTLYSISLKYGIPLVVLIRANPYVDVYNLQVGETVCVPMKQGGCSGSCGRNTEEHNSFDGSYARGENDREDNQRAMNRRDDDWEEDQIGMDRRGDGSRGENQPEMDRRVEDGGCRDDGREDSSDRGGFDQNGRIAMSWSETSRRTMMEEDSAEEEDHTEPESDDSGTRGDSEAEHSGWQRYISKPGDTLDVVVNMEGSQPWEEFLEQNPMDRIYLLPGIAYRCKKM